MAACVQEQQANTLETLRELADLVIPFALRAACDMGIADHLIAGPLHVEKLAGKVGADPSSLWRLLRALASRGIFAEDQHGIFALSPVAELLCGDHPLSLRDGLALIGPDLAAWAYVDYSIRTGQSAFDYIHGQSYYDKLARDEDFRELFDRSVETQNRIMLRPLLAAYDWSGCGTIVDLAGGTGVFLAGLLARYPQLRGVLFDLPHVVSRAPPVLEAAGVTERCAIEPGNLFDAVPTGRDTYLLKTVLHDWPDARARRILDVVAEAMRTDSRVIVIEALLPSGDAFHIGKLLDMNSLVLAAGPDRDESHLLALLSSAGLEHRRVVRTATLAILEAASAR
ncbi:MAG TPA: methyltransferase [Solirubrobacteraceae bacterium]|jgi:hypothetical protein|nr:methyltransferase [Solirubrobacteraceae bacterium]